MPSSTICSERARVMSWPSKRMLPETADSRPEMVRRVVVLPAPLEPSNVTT